MDSTLEYYNKNADRFVRGTFSVDFSETQERYLSKLKAIVHLISEGAEYKERR